MMSWIVWFPNDGGVSGSTTSIVNSSVSESPSASVTVYVYGLALCVAVGLPDSVSAESLNPTPRGGDCDNE